MPIRSTRRSRLFSLETQSSGSTETDGDEMLNIQAISVVVCLAILPTYVLSHPAIRIREAERRECRPCGNECDKCEYGVVISQLCGVFECRKGPDERCGGHNRGVCGDGMICLCERCIGCSVDTLKCSDSNLERVCLPKDEREPRYLELQRNHHFTLV